MSVCDWETAITSSVWISDLRSANGRNALLTAH